MNNDFNSFDDGRRQAASLAPAPRDIRLYQARLRSRLRKHPKWFMALIW